MITIPPYLNPGDTIGITCPAGYMNYKNAQKCIATLHSWGYKTEVGKTLGSDSENYFSAPDQIRLNEMQNMLDNKTIKAILFARGGYGLSRIIDDLNFKKFKKNPKWLIGYSDITVLHCHLFSKYKIASLHAPMAAAFNEPDGDIYVRKLKNVLEGVKNEYECAPHSFNNEGEASGTLIGGNLALLTHVIGTSSEYSTKDKIFFLEDIGEYIYSIDRMLYQLKRSGKFKNLSALILGSFTDMKDTERPFGKGIDEVLQHFTKSLDCPVCYNFPVGHTAKNVTLKIGGNYKLTVNRNGASLKDL